MNPDISSSARVVWRALSRLDLAALAVVLLYAFAWLARLLHSGIPTSGFLRFLFLLCLGYFVVRLLGWARVRLLWSLRNRLIIAYVFIAVVPVLLLLAMAGLSAYLIYSNLGAHLAYDDLQGRIEKVASAADTLAAILAPEGKSAAAPMSSPAAARALAAASAQLPGLQVEVNKGDSILQAHGGLNHDRFAGPVQRGTEVDIRAVVSRQTPSGHLVVSASLPVTPEFLDTLAPDLGPIQLVLFRPADSSAQRGVVYMLGNRRFVTGGQIGPRRRTLPPPASWLDYPIEGISKLEAVAVGPDGLDQGSSPLFLSFSARPSRLNRRLFSSLGELRDFIPALLFIIGVFFLFIEAAALMTGIVMTQTITGAVADLYRATQYVQAGDFSHRIRIRKRDQLGSLAESFNSMTGSIGTLIEEQRQRQRLENELSIAREVQAQLFPRSLPEVPGVQLQAICRPARVVSGDYYDFIRLGPASLGIAIADISGKGISAALLMASLQAALRSQVLVDGSGPPDTAKLVSRLNLHLFLNTSSERYATLFYAAYDAATRTLRYTNAGHHSPLYISGDGISRLEEGGMVVGLFDDCTYEQGKLQVEPGSLLVAFSDGLVEPENVYGEQFGAGRIIDVASRHRETSPQVLAEMLVNAAEEWAGTPEQADDMTVIVARFG